MSCFDLSILCVTRAERAVLPLLHRMAEDARQLGAEFVLVIDGTEVPPGVPVADITATVRSKGYIESVLDSAIEVTTRPYILRLDDDESMSRSMMQWLASRAYSQDKHWKFPRAHLWGDEHHFVSRGHLYPDHQTRLSTRALAGGRHTIHCGSPHGGGTEAPCAIEHHRFLVRDHAARLKQVERYDQLQAGAGTCFRPFQVPEDVGAVLDVLPWPQEST